jgi:transcriptional antiterminator RfaH
MKRWYCVQTAPQGEAVAARHLERQGFEVWLPLCAKRRRHARRTEIVAAPLFPSYLFVAFDRNVERWRSINGTRGCRALVGAGDAPMPLPHGIVEALRSRCDAAGLIPTSYSLAKLAPGAAVRILAGPFAELLGRIEAAAENDRVSLLLDVLGRMVRVRLPITAVEAA